MNAPSVMTSFWNVRTIGRLEALSYLLLLGVAMPLKYVGNIPQAVMLAGSLHGLLFLLYLLVVWQQSERERWPWVDRLEALAAAFLPLGPFLLELGTQPVPHSPDSADPAQPKPT